MPRTTRHKTVEKETEGTVNIGKKRKQDQKFDRQAHGNQSKKPKQTKSVKTTDKCVEGNSSQTKGARKVKEKTTVKFIEDDQYVEMSAEGQNTDFLSEDDLAQESSDDEVTFSSQETQENNNATIDDLEEGECSQNSEEVLNKSAVNSGDKADKIIDQKIEASLSKVQNYFEEKFTNYARVVELEKQLAENRKHLQELKEKGRVKEVSAPPEPSTMVVNGNVDDGSSELTIYCNAVQMKRNSSSSEEENYVDTSGEQIESDTFLIPEISVTERELEEDRDQGRRQGRMEQQNKDMADGRDQPAQMEHKQKAITQKEMAEDKGARIV